VNKQTPAVLKILVYRSALAMPRIICDPSPVFCFFRQVPGFAPVAAVGSKFHWRVGGGDLVLGCGQSGAFRGVFAFAADRTSGGVVHREAFRKFLAAAVLQRVFATGARGRRRPSSANAAIDANGR